MENHLHRREVEVALTEGEGYHIRESASTKNAFFYYARRYGPLVIRSAVVYDREIRNFLRSEPLFLLYFLVVFVVFGVMLLGVAIYMLERILPESVVMLLWAALLVISAVYMGVFSPLPEGRGWAKLWKGVGILMLVYGVTLVVGAAGGGRDVLQPLKGVFASSGAGGSGEAEPVFRRVVGMAGLEQALAENRGRTVMLDFYADWCVSCKEMEKYTFPDPAVRRALEGVVLLQVDVTGNTGDDKALMKRFGLFGPPAMLFFDSKGQEQQPLRLVGFLPADQFAAHVNRAVSLP
ncbi:MAG TPA: thioredoxin family protein [Thiolinea sp.]|nr:thioredoxin family protein [Thiolinea sp.]